MDDDGFKSFVRYVLGTILAVLLLAYGVIGAVRTYYFFSPHDWDCSAHGGMILPPQSPYVFQNFICKDGYRP